MNKPISISYEDAAEIMLQLVKIAIDVDSKDLSDCDAEMWLQAELYRFSEILREAGFPKLPSASAVESELAWRRALGERQENHG